MERGWPLGPGDQGFAKSMEEEVAGRETHRGPGVSNVPAPRRIDSEQEDISQHPALLLSF